MKHFILSLATIFSSSCLIAQNSYPGTGTALLQSGSNQALTIKDSRAGNNWNYIEWLFSNGTRDWLLGRNQNNGMFSIYREGLNEVFTIDNAGAVGIGTTTFGNEKLSLAGNAQWQLRMRDVGTGGGDWRLGVTSNNWGITNGKFLISNTNLSSDASFVIDNSRNVGIGTTAPATRLHVQGNGSLNVDFKVTGRIQSGDANGFGGMWVNSAGTMFMGQQGGSSIGFFNNSAWRLVVNQDGNVGIGTTSPDEKLTVNGKIHAKEVIIDLAVPAPDYVFAQNYPLTPLDEVQAYIAQHKHLPEVPSAKEMEKDGVKVGEMEMLLLKKIEELTLYVIELKDENKLMKSENDELKKLILDRLTELENNANKK
jgi:hypothetical protein